MRHVPLNICGESLQLPVSFEAGERLERAGYDPLVSAFKSRGGNHLSSQGVITVLWIGAVAAGSKLTRPQIGQAVYDAGTNKFLGDAVDYLAAFVEAEPEYPVPAAPGGDEKNGQPQ